MPLRVRNRLPVQIQGCLPMRTSTRVLRLPRAVMPRLLLLLLLGLCACGAIRSRTDARRSPSCYEFSSPVLFGARPDRIVLDSVTEPVAQIFGQSNARRIRSLTEAPPLRARRPDLASTYWQPISEDSIELVQTDGFSSISLRMAVTGRGLIGQAQNGYDIPVPPAANPSWPVQARRVSCAV